MEESERLPDRLSEPSILDLSEQEIEALAARYREAEVAESLGGNEQLADEGPQISARESQGPDGVRPGESTRNWKELRSKIPSLDQVGDSHRLLVRSGWLEFAIVVAIAGLSLYLLFRPSCDIKGNISFRTGERIYHMPGDAYYRETVIDRRAGEHWFCSEEEARQAGWRRAYR